MDNDLFSATETLGNAYREVLKNNKPRSKWGMRGMFIQFKEAIEQRNLTVSEKLLLCYNSDKKDIFSSRDVNKQNEEETRRKLIAFHDEDRQLFEAFRKLPKKEQDRIRKELGLDRLFSVSENNTTDAFEHSNSKDGKNGK